MTSVAVACVYVIMLVGRRVVMDSVKLFLLPNLVQGSQLKHWDMCTSLHVVSKLLCDQAVAKLLGNSVNTQKIMLRSWCCLQTAMRQLGC